MVFLAELLLLPLSSKIIIILKMFELEKYLLNLFGIIQEYGVVGAFLGTFLEELIAPIPSSLVLFFFGSVFFFQETISFWLILKLVFFFALSASLGATLGAVPFYFLTYILGKPFVDRFGKLFNLNWRDLEKIEKFLHKKQREIIILLFLRIMPIVPSIAINVFFGLIRLHWWKFFLVSFFGNWIRAIILGFFGWQLSFYFGAVFNILKELESFGWLLLPLVLIIIYYFVKRR